MKRLCIFADGTLMDADSETDPDLYTNVAKLSRALLDEAPGPSGPILQSKMYQSGVGTDQAPLGGLVSGALGSGMMRMVKELYDYICLNWEQGDEIHLFGFSRGAYIVRLLSSFINIVGILHPTVNMHVFPAIFDALDEHKGDGGEADEKAQKKLAALLEPLKPFRRAQQKALKTKCLIKSLCVFDTVTTRGRPSALRFLEQEKPKVNSFGIDESYLEPCVEMAFQALAADERRVDYTPTLWRRRTGGKAEANGQKLLQVWFSGAHSDIGGGYKEQDLSFITLTWMIAQVQDFLAFDFEYLKRIEAKTTALYGQAKPHQSRTSEFRFAAAIDRELPDELDSSTMERYHPSILQQPPEHLRNDLRQILASPVGTSLLYKLKPIERALQDLWADPNSNHDASHSSSSTWPQIFKTQSAPPVASTLSAPPTSDESTAEHPDAPKIRRPLTRTSSVTSFTDNESSPPPTPTFSESQSPSSSTSSLPLNDRPDSEQEEPVPFRRARRKSSLKDLARRMRRALRTEESKAESMFTLAKILSGPLQTRYAPQPDQAIPLVDRPFPSTSSSSPLPTSDSSKVSGTTACDDAEVPNSDLSDGETDEEDDEKENEPVDGGVYDTSLPSPQDFRDEVKAYLESLAPVKRKKALLSRKLHDFILSVLLEPRNTTLGDAQLRFWVRQRFTILSTTEGDLVAHEDKPVVTRDDIYRVLCLVHVETKHGGRDKTFGMIKARYSYIPKPAFSIVGDSFYLRSQINPGCLGTEFPDLDPQTRVVIRIGYENSTLPTSLPSSTDWSDPTVGDCIDLDESTLVPLVAIDAPETVTQLSEFNSSFVIDDTNTFKWTLNDVSFQNFAYNPILQQVWRNETVDSDRVAIVTAPLTSIDLAISNVQGADHPFHLHNIRMFVVARGTGLYRDSAAAGNVTLRLNNPIRRDTVGVPPGEWVLVRLRTDIPGVHAFHCHIVYHQAVGLLGALVVQPDVIRTFDIPADNLALCANGNTSVIDPGRKRSLPGGGPYAPRYELPAAPVNTALVKNKMMSTAMKDGLLAGWW
ncbi:hypothetical protein JCM10207_002856 [Rhodosporidiobolus poonsookiae]